MKGAGRSFASVRQKLHKFSRRDAEDDRKGGGKGFRHKGKGKGGFRSKGKGKGKGKGKRVDALKSQFWEKKKDEENRTDLDGTYTGIITKYVYTFGWGFIAPDDVDALPDTAKEALEKQKAEAREKAEAKDKEASDETLVYFRKPDVDADLFPLHNDIAVTFELYTDDKGIGAHNIQ